MPDQQKPTQASRFQQDVLAFLKLAAKYGGAQFTCNQMIMLGEVWVAYAEGRSICAADLRELCNMPKSTASRILASLGDEGLRFIAAELDPKDHRRKCLLPSTRLMRLEEQMSRDFRSYGNQRG